VGACANRTVDIASQAYPTARGLTGNVNPARDISQVSYVRDRRKWASLVLKWAYSLLQMNTHALIWKLMGRRKLLGYACSEFFIFFNHFTKLYDRFKIHQF
jgi:hypothetical protein